MWVFDVDAEAELLEDPPLGLDDPVLEVDVVVVQHHWGYRPKRTKTQIDATFNQAGMWLNSPSRTDLLDVFEDVDDVPGAARRLLDLAGQADARHGRLVEGQAHEGLGVVEAMEQHAPRRHSHLEKPGQ